MEKLCRSVKTLYLLPKTSQINLRLIASVSSTTNGFAHLSKSSQAFRCLGLRSTEHFRIDHGASLLQIRHVAGGSQGLEPEHEAKHEADEAVGVDAAEESANEPQKPRSPLRSLNVYLDRLESTISQYSRVGSIDYNEAFTRFTRAYQTLLQNGNLDDKLKSEFSFAALTLIKSCGKLMSYTRPQIREQLAGALWTFLKEKEVPLDTLHYNYILATLNDNESTFDPQKFIDEMTNNGLEPNRVTYQRAIHQYCLQGDISKATSLLEKMRNLGMSLTEQIFASLVLGYSKQTESPSIDELFELMSTNGISPGGQIYATAIVSRVQMAQSNPKALDELRDIIERMKNEEIALSSTEASEVLAKLAPIKDHELGIAVRQSILSNLPLANHRYLQSVVGALLEGGQAQVASELFWSRLNFQSSLKSPAAFRNNSINYIRLMAFHENVPADFAISEVEKILQADHMQSPVHLMYQVAAENGRLELVRACLKKISETEKIRVHYTWPLVVQAKDEAELAKVIKEDLIGKFNIGEIKETLVTWVCSKYYPDLSKFEELNKQIGLERNVILTSFVEYALTQNLLEDALEQISQIQIPDSPSTEGGDDQASEERAPKIRVGPTMLGRLLGMATDKGDTELIEKINKICQPMGRSSAANSPQVRFCIERGDYDSALKAFIDAAENQGITPKKPELMRHFLETKNPEGLQKLMAAATRVHGQMNTLFDLAIVCFELDQYKQAQKIIRSPGFRVNPDRIYRQLESLASGSNVERLENYVHLVKHLQEVDSEKLYSVLLQFYRKHSQAQRALELWNTMQDEDSQISKKVLTEMADLLRSNGLPVPFEKLGFGL